jgi:hypothetical protein
MSEYFSIQIRLRRNVSSVPPYARRISILAVAELLISHIGRNDDDYVRFVNLEF